MTTGGGGFQKQEYLMVVYFYEQKFMISHTKYLDKLNVRGNYCVAASDSAWYPLCLL